MSPERQREREREILHFDKHQGGYPSIKVLEIGGIALFIYWSKHLVTHLLQASILTVWKVFMWSFYFKFSSAACMGSICSDQRTAVISTLQKCYRHSFTDSTRAAFQNSGHRHGSHGPRWTVADDQLQVTQTLRLTKTDCISSSKLEIYLFCKKNLTQLVLIRTKCTFITASCYKKSVKRNNDNCQLNSLSRVNELWFPKTAAHCSFN